MTVHFSKTERLTDGKWLATIAPADIRKGLTYKPMDYIKDEEFLGDIISISATKHEVTIRCFNKFPCVGREYKIENK